ncbi:MAG: DegV family protein [Erysipelotrichaceae bacterium]|jgi:DegV family protein with EDD domain|nr:DegV family protein [Erysipelotrichaceae bacterium]
MAKYQIFTDSSCDLSTEIRKAHNLEYFYFGLVVDGVEYRADLDWVDYAPDQFYGWLEQGKKIKTTQVSMQEVIDRVTPYFEKGIDIIYIGCSSALTGSMNLFELAKRQLLEQYPERKMIGVDSLTASVTLGMLVLDAKKKQDEGFSIEQLEKWVLDNRLLYNQFATVDTLTYLRASGRIKGLAAFLGNIMSVKPIFISDRKGNNYTINKVKGTKASLNELFEGVKNAYVEGETKEIYIGHGRAFDRAEMLKKRVEEELKIPAHILWIGPIVGTTCGPGVLGIFCRGKEVTRFEGEPKVNNQ